MPKAAPHKLIWSHKHQCYELHSHGQLQQSFRREDEPAFSGWLAQQTAFAFVGQAGRLSIFKEARPRGSSYWYAYATHAQRFRKRYLGDAARVTFARLEETAKALTRQSSPDSGDSAPSSLGLEAQGAGSHREDVGRAGERPNTVPHAKQREVLFTKLLSPSLPTALAQRERLLRKLDMARSFPLTLISASAGSGKTTLLSAWVAASKVQQENEATTGDVEREGAKAPCTWLALDMLDNDLIPFWDSVIAALRTCLPSIGETALIRLHAHQPPPLSTILVALLNELAQQEKEIVLILDDYHVITDQTIEEAMRFLLDHLPAHLHLVLSTRIDPDLPLSRFRMRGQLVEIRDQDLRFTREEASQFLRQRMMLSLSEEEVTALHQRTEGWIAGLQLAALSLHKQEDRSAWISHFAGSHRYLLDYVQQDILAQLSVPLQHFLLQTSILTSMNADLCQAVTEASGPQESQQMLEELERANLFVVPLDEERQWYRYHDLFREALLARLQARQLQWLPLLHLRAARWYEAAGSMREAVAHALAADYPYAASLMEQAAPGFWLGGEAKTVHTWVMALPDTLLRTKARFALSAVFRLQESLHMSVDMLQGRTHAQAEQSLVRLEEVLQNRTSPVLPESEGRVLKRRLLLMRGWRAGFELTKIGDAVMLSQLVQEMQEEVLEEEVTWKMIPCILTYWLRETLQREAGLLVPMLEQIKQEAKRSGDPLILLRVMSMLTLAYFKAGQLRRAEQEGLAALELAKHSGIQTYVTGYLHYWLGLIYYQHNQIEEAFQSVQRELHIARFWQQVDLLRVGAHFLTQIALARGDFAVAEQALQELEQIYQRHPLAYIPPWTAAARVWYWLKTGNLAAAQQWANQSGLDPQRWDPNQKSALLMLVRVYLAQQQSALALQILQRFRQHLDRPGDFPTAIEWMTLYVAALYLSGNREQAMCIATQLVQMTEPEGAIRVYLDAGPSMKQVLKALLATSQDDEPDAPDASISRPYVLCLLATFEQQEEDRSTPQRDTSSAIAPKTPPYAPSHVVQQGLSKPLSPQEQRVLPLLVAGRTYTEMAEELIVSAHTIKTQVNSIYRKLGVSRRAEAIAVARRLRLL